MANIRLLLLIGACAAFVSAGGEDRKASRATAKLPRAVLSALTAKFPGAEITKWSKEKEAGVVLYDIEFTQAGKKFEADVRADGAIDNWERAIPSGEIPDAIRRTVASTYPNSSIQEAMAVTDMKAGKESLQGYEVTLRTSAQQSVEMTIAPDGKVLEDSGAGARKR